MRKRKYKGNNAGIVIKNVEAPEPSSCATTAIITVITATTIMFPFESAIILLINGSNNPTSCIIPKKIIAKINITATFITELNPELKNSPNSSKLKPAINAATIGGITIATSGDTRPLISRATIIIMVKIRLYLNSKLFPPFVIDHSDYLKIS